MSCDSESFSPDTDAITSTTSRTSTTVDDLQDEMNYQYAIADITDYNEFVAVNTTITMDLTDPLQDIVDDIADDASCIINGYSNSHKDITYYELIDNGTTGGVTSVDLRLFIGLDQVPAMDDNASHPYDCCLDQGDCVVTGDETWDFENVYEEGLNNTETYKLNFSNHEFWKNRETKVFYIGPTKVFKDMNNDYVDAFVDVNITDLYNYDSGTCGVNYNPYWTTMKTLIANNKPTGKKVARIDVGWEKGGLTEGDPAKFYHFHGMRVTYANVTTHTPITGAPFEVQLLCP